MKVAIYSRISTHKQELENQLIQLRRYCHLSNYEIFNEYTDIQSGKDNSRPQYNQLFIDAQKKLFDIVLFWDISRFSRSGTLFTLQKLKELDNLGIKWHSYQEPYFSSIGEFKDVVISILATLAKVEREKISERTKAGLERAKSKGKKLGRKSVPKNIEEKIADMVSQIKPLSYKQISNMVTYKTKYGKVHHVSPSTISKIKNQHLEKEGVK